MKIKLLIAFSIVGIFALLLISVSIKPKDINSKILQNSSGYVRISGKVISERSYEDFKLLIIQDNYGKATVSCFGCPKILNKSVLVEGNIEVYQKMKQIAAEKISLI